MMHHKRESVINSQIPGSEFLSIIHREIPNERNCGASTEIHFESRIPHQSAQAESCSLHNEYMS